MEYCPLLYSYCMVAHRYGCTTLQLQHMLLQQAYAVRTSTTANSAPKSTLLQPKLCRRIRHSLSTDPPPFTAHVCKVYRGGSSIIYGLAMIRFRCKLSHDKNSEHCRFPNTLMNDQGRGKKFLFVHASYASHSINLGPATDSQSLLRSVQHEH